MTPTEALAAALEASDLMRRYREYAHDAHPRTMRAEPPEGLARSWAAAILAALDGYTLVPVGVRVTGDAGLREAVRDYLVWLEAYADHGDGPILPWVKASALRAALATPAPKEADRE